MSRPTVLISGAGIAGSTLAFLLARRGFRPTVTERARGLRSSGTPVDVQDEAFDVAAEMGVTASLREAATQVSRMAFVDREGRQIAGMALPVNDARHVEIPRSDLARILCQAAQRDSELLFDETVTGVQQDPGGVEVTFERMAPRRFDYLIGCDGLHSTVRRLVFGPERSFIDDLGLFVATFPLSGGAEADEVVVYNVPNRAVTVHPGRGQAIAAFMFRAPAIRDFDSSDTPGHRQLLDDAFRGVGWRAPEFLDQLRSVDDFYFDTVSRVQLESWSKGRVTLVGDAASCVSFLGGGSSNAMAGAALLAEALGATPADPQAAFDRYERQQRKRVGPKLRNVGLASHFLIPATRGGIVLRNAALRMRTAFN